MPRNRRKPLPGKAQVAVASRGDIVGQIAFNVRADLRDLMLRGGLALLKAMFEEDVAELCGPRYAHGGQEEPAYRWGSQRGVAVLGGQKLTISRPRVRKGGKEVLLRTYEAVNCEDPLNDRAFEQMVVGVSTRKYGRSIEHPGSGAERSAVSRSAVSRRFVVMSRAQMEATLSEPLGDRQWAALMLDGIEFAEHVVVIALGIDSSGEKHVLGIREGSTENATLCREMLSDIVARGLPADQSMLIVIDGGKGLRKAIHQVFGSYAIVQRCQVHKRRNVLDQLPEDRRPNVRSVMEQAYAPTTSCASATAQLKNLARSLQEKHPSAAASLLEGLEETLAIKALGLSETLARCLSTTNAIENLNGSVRHVARRVKRWRGGSMVLRWVATGVLEAKRGFRRLRGYKGMPALWKALRDNDNQLRGDSISKVG